MLLKWQLVASEVRDCRHGCHEIPSSRPSPLTTPMNNAISKVKEYLETTELEKIGKSLVVPTRDEKVREILRYLKEPVTYFGEDRADRRARLRRVMAQRKKDGLEYTVPADEESEDEELAVDYVTHGSADLIEARHDIQRESATRSSRRLSLELARFRVYENNPKGFLMDMIKEKRVIETELLNLAPYGSQSGFQRPVSSLKFNPFAAEVVVGDWSGAIHLLDRDTLETTSVSTDHIGQISGLAWGSRNVLASGALEGKVFLHDAALQITSTLEGHTSRVAKLDFYPTGRYLATASYDCTWRLWHCESGKELLTQPGHSKAVHDVKFNSDGNLILSAGLDGLGRVWDLRSGKPVMILDGHLREIYGAGWCPNGFEAVTAGADNNVLVWDLRQMAKCHEIPAHLSVVSDLKVTDKVLVTGSYDTTVRFWDLTTWDLLCTVNAGEKVLSVDMQQNWVGIGRWDRTIDIYS